VKLLRILQEKEFERVGGDFVIPMKARIIVATNKNIQKLVEEGKFREDLFYRLNVVTIEVPPLRDRKNDIVLLINHFIQKINLELHKNVSKVSKGAMDLLTNHEWIGNVRELENTLMQAIVLSNGDVLEADNILLRQMDRMHSEFDDITKYSIADVEKKHIEDMLKAVQWDKPRAAKYLGVSLPTLYSKIESYKIQRA
jgi:transcriptional regulator with PAS, ATPase and Fis domain